MDQGSLVREAIDAGAELIRQFNDLMPVTAAFWAKSPETGRWDLYIASDQIDDGKAWEGYGEVLRILNAMRSPYLRPFRVKLIGSREPMAQAVLKLLRGYPGPLPNHYDGFILGDTVIDGAYLYEPPPAAVGASV